MLIFGCRKMMIDFNPLSTAVRSLSNKSCIYRKPRRTHYLRQYPTLIVLADGSTYTVGYHEPRKIIKLPLDLSQLSDEERKVMLERRTPKKKVKVAEEVKDSYNSKLYLQYIKRKK